MVLYLKILNLRDASQRPEGLSEEVFFASYDNVATEDLFVSNVDNTSQLYMYVFRFQILILDFHHKF